VTSNVSWILKLEINAGKLEEFKALAEEMAAATRDEEGALAYEWFLSDDSQTCHIYERYADSAATLIHLGNFGAKFAARFLPCVTPRGFEVYGPAAEQVRAALADFGPTYFEQFAGFVR